MGCASSKSPESLQNDAIQKKILNDKRVQDRVLKLLLLGTGDSGKTTVFKQIRILYGEGFSDEKRAALKLAIHNNLILGAQAVIRAANDSVAGKPLNDEALRRGDSLLRLEENHEMNADIAADIAFLWNDDNFQSAWSERSNFQVLDGWEDFAKQCHKYPEWGGPNWIPSIPDAIRARVRTSGILEEDFYIDQLRFTLIDVGGQRNERRKWIHCFQEVSAVIFVAAISEYDQVLFEARGKNRLEEAVELFDNICNSEWFTKTNLVLFLNKSDIFRYKYCERKVPINKSGLFPDAPTSFEYKEGVDWMKTQFLSRNRVPGKHIFAHITCATDTYNVQVVFDACKDSLLRESLETLGLMS